MSPSSQIWLKRIVTLAISGAILFLPGTASSQTFSADKLIRLLNTTGVQQTNNYGAANLDVYQNPNIEKLKKLVAAVKKKLSADPDTRLSIRLTMYEWSHEKLLKPKVPGTAENYFKLIQSAEQFGDEQLLSELFIQYVHLCRPNEQLYYLLKCIEIRERIGINYFSDISNSYYWASEWLFQINNYKHSANYAAKCVALYRKREKDRSLFPYILAADIAGASQLKLGQPDSAIFYYKIIEEVVNDRLADPGKYAALPMKTADLQVWKGVVKGGIGRAYTLKKDYDAAYSLLQTNLRSSINFKQWADAAGVQNSLATIDKIKGRQKLALTRYVQAYNWAFPSKKLPALIDASQGASQAYEGLGNFVKAHWYHKNYLKWKSLQDNNVNQKRLDLAEFQVRYEQAQKNFQIAQIDLKSQKRIRNWTIATTISLAIAALLLYNRNRLTTKLKQEKLEREKLQIEHKIRSAHQEIEFITKNIAEKNNRISSLQSQLKAVDNVEINNLLNNFTILTDDDWKKFKLEFETVNPGFLQRLKEKFPNITQAEQRIMLLTKLGFNNKEMANATGVSPVTIRSVIARLRKKFDLEQDIATIASDI